MNILNKIMSTFSKPVTPDIEGKEFELIGNCFGFLGLSAGVGTSTLICELACQLADRHLNICIVDLNPTSTFYLTKVMHNATEDLSKAIPSMAVRLRKRSAQLNEILMPLTSGVKVLTFAGMPVIDSFNLDYSCIKETIEELKTTFDLVLLDIPALPWLEPTIAGLQTASTVYTVLGFSLDCILRKPVFDKFFDTAGLENITSNVILMGCPKGQSIKVGIESKLGVHVLAEIPTIPNLPTCAMSNLACLEKLSGREAIHYAECLDFFTSEILEGISGKSIKEEV